MTNKEAIEELKKVDTLDMPARLCEAYYMSIKALEQEPSGDEYIKVPKNALKYRTAGMVAYNVEWLKNHFDIERAVICGEQEPYSDEISRQAVLDVLDENSFTDSCIKVRQLPPVNPQEPKWIPVSERMPESCGMYIVTRKIYDCPDTAPIIMSDESWFDGQNTWHNDNRINHERGYLSDVIAWMPLPAPFDTQESEDKE